MNAHMHTHSCNKGKQKTKTNVLICDIILNFYTASQIASIASLYNFEIHDISKKILAIFIKKKITQSGSILKVYF